MDICRVAPICQIGKHSNVMLYDAKAIDLKKYTYYMKSKRVFPGHRQLGRHLLEMPILKQFLDRTSIHGLPEIFLTKHLATKLFWIVCIFGCFGMMIHEIWVVSRGLGTNTVASRINNVQSSSYEPPNILICPGRYFNATKVQQARIRWANKDSRLFLPENNSKEAGILQ